MSPPSPKLPWYQFSLRSLFSLTIVVAVFCSIGACTHWFVPVLIALIVLIGGVAGQIVAGTRLGFMQGTAFATEFVLIAGVVCIVFRFPVPLLFWDASWEGGVYAVLGIATASLVGGIVGGYTVRPRRR